MSQLGRQFYFLTRLNNGHVVPLLRPIFNIIPTSSSEKQVSVPNVGVAGQVAVGGYGSHVHRRQIRGDLSARIGRIRLHHRRHLFQETSFENGAFDPQGGFVIAMLFGREFCSSLLDYISEL